MKIWQQKDVESGWEDTIKEDAQEFEPLPEGDYNVTIEKFDRSRSSGSGKLPACNMAVVYFNVHAPQTESSISIHDNYVLLHSKTGMEIYLHFFSGIGLKKEGVNSFG